MIPSITTTRTVDTVISKGFYHGRNFDAAIQTEACVVLVGGRQELGDTEPVVLPIYGR